MQQNSLYDVQFSPPVKYSTKKHIDACAILLISRENFVILHQ